MFPENSHGMQESVITSIILTTDFLIFSNDVSTTCILDGQVEFTVCLSNFLIVRLAAWPFSVLFA